jgi:hypothetical protein
MCLVWVRSVSGLDQADRAKIADGMRFFAQAA